MTEPTWRAMAAEEFSVRDSIGGVRGLLESSAPGVVFVVAYLVWGGFRAPTIAAVATVLVLVAFRLIQRTPVTHALGGVFGVGLGALWAWRFADPGGYFVPGFWLNGLYLAALVLSIAVRWPAVGVIVSLVRGEPMAFRRDGRLRRRYAYATAVLAALFAVRLGVQLPLYWADEVAALGVARVSMGLPLLALTVWVTWLMVRNAAPPRAAQDPPPSTK